MAGHGQASEAELRAALREKGALELDGQWHRLDEAFLGELLELILLTAVAQGWSFHAVPCQDMAACLHQDGYDPRCP